MLLDELGGTILCSQPRRLAVVAIANRVAQQQGMALGTEVGYRIGQQSVAHKGTKLLFTTAGLLLEELRANVRRTTCSSSCSQSVVSFLASMCQFTEDFGSHMTCQLKKQPQQI